MYNVINRISPISFKDVLPKDIFHYSVNDLNNIYKLGFSPKNTTSPIKKASTIERTQLTSKKPSETIIAKSSLHYSSSLSELQTNLDKPKNKNIPPEKKVVHPQKINFRNKSLAHKIKILSVDELPSQPK